MDAPPPHDRGLDPDGCYRALCAKDARFDGVFFVGVATTGIYCRPVCRARTPGRDRCTFYRAAAAAERDGFRACFRCRPELAPGSSRSDATSVLVARAVSRIEAGALDEGDLESLARALGASARHVRRALHDELGVSPIELAQSRRLALAKQLLHDSRASITEVALASGFASVRRFNAAFLARFGCAPSSLRRARPASASAPSTMAVTLGYRAPLDWVALLAFLARRATAGVERVEGGAYLRTMQLGDRAGWVRVAPLAGRDALRAEIALPLAGGLTPVVARLRRVFDLDAHPDAIVAHLGRDRALRALVRARPGLRVPGAFDPFELTARAVLGQQVSVAAANTLAGRLAQRFGAPIETPHPSLVRLFPRAETVAEAGVDALASLGLPRARAATLAGVARAFASGALHLASHDDPAHAIAALEALPGIGPWTAEYVAMRVLGAPDAFPAGDLALRRALGVDSPVAARDRAQPWRPWRAYAALQLWTSLGDTP